MRKTNLRVALGDGMDAQVAFIVSQPTLKQKDQSWSMRMFEEQVSKLRAARQLKRQFQEEVDESYEEWRLTNGDLIGRAEQAKIDLGFIEAYLRADVLDHFKETGEKKPHPKLGVRVSKKPVYDEEVATRFAFNTVPELLALDKKAFESYAKGVMKSAPLAFVEWEEKVTATIARDLEE